MLSKNLVTESSILKHLCRWHKCPNQAEGRHVSMNEKIFSFGFSPRPEKFTESKADHGLQQVQWWPQG